MVSVSPWRDWKQALNVPALRRLAKLRLTAVFKRMRQVPTSALPLKAEVELSASDVRYATNRHHWAELGALYAGRELLPKVDLDSHIWLRPIGG